MIAPNLRFLTCSFMILSALTTSIAGPLPNQTTLEEVQAVLKKQSLDKRLEISFKLDPFHLSGDFDGDGKPDVAIFVRDKTTGKTGIAISNSHTAKVFVVGAGTNLGNGGDNFDWIDVWKVQPKKKSGPSMKGDGLLVEKSESGGGLIYWNGVRYVWRQQGD